MFIYFHQAEDNLIDFPSWSTLNVASMSVRLSYKNPNFLFNYIDVRRSCNKKVQALMDPLHRKKKIYYGLGSKFDSEGVLSVRKPRVTYK